MVGNFFFHLKRQIIRTQETRLQRFWLFAVLERIAKQIDAFPIARSRTRALDLRDKAKCGKRPFPLSVNRIQRGKAHSVRKKQLLERFRIHALLLGFGREETEHGTSRHVIKALIILTGKHERFFGSHRKGNAGRKLRHRARTRPLASVFNPALDCPKAPIAAIPDIAQSLYEHLEIRSMLLGNLDRSLKFELTMGNRRIMIDHPDEPKSPVLD